MWLQHFMDSYVYNSSSFRENFTKQTVVNFLRKQIVLATMMIIRFASCINSFAIKRICCSAFGKHSAGGLYISNGFKTKQIR